MSSQRCLRIGLLQVAAGSSLDWQSIIDLLMIDCSVPALCWVLFIATSVYSHFALFRKTVLAVLLDIVQSFHPHFLNT